MYESFFLFTTALVLSSELLSECQAQRNYTRYSEAFNKNETNSENQNTNFQNMNHTPPKSLIQSASIKQNQQADFTNSTQGSSFITSNAATCLTLPTNTTYFTYNAYPPYCHPLSYQIYPIQNNCSIIHKNPNLPTQSTYIIHPKHPSCLNPPVYQTNYLQPTSNTEFKNPVQPSQPTCSTNPQQVVNPNNPNQPSKPTYSTNSQEVINPNNPNEPLPSINRANSTVYTQQGIPRDNTKCTDSNISTTTITPGNGVNSFCISIQNISLMLIFCISTNKIYELYL